MSALIKTPQQDHETRAAQARDDAAAAWRLAGGAGARHVRCTRDGDVTTLDERVRLDAHPAELVGEGENKRAVFARPRLSLDGDLELVVDETLSRRLSTCEDFQLSDLALSQLDRLAPRLRALAVTGLKGVRVGADGLARRRDVQDDAAMTGRLVRKHGTDDPRRLRTVLFLSPEATRTVSRLAAADDMMDLFVGAELIAQAKEFQRVEHRKPYFREFFPMRNLAAPGAKAYTTQYFDRKGRAEHTANFRGRAPTVSIMREEKLRPLVWLRAGMLWSWLQLQEWAQAKSNGAPLPDFVAEQRDAAREALLELENLDLVFGNANLEILGLLSPGNLIPTPAAEDNYEDQPTNEAVVQLLLKGAKAIVSTESDAVPEVIALGTRDYLYVTTTTYDAANSNGESIAEVALRRGKDLGVKAIVRMPELGPSQEVKDYLQSLGYADPELTLYSGGMFDAGENAQLAVQLTISRNAKKIRGVTGQDFMQLPPNKTDSETSVQVCMSTGGVEVLHPKAAHRQPIKDPQP
jgi:hypothetical protein